MITGKKILICDNSYEFGRILYKRLEDAGYKPVCRRNDLNALYDEIILIKPEAVILSITSTNENIITFVLNITKLIPDIKIIAVTFISSRLFNQKLIDNGVCRCILMPAAMNEICNAVSEEINCNLPSTTESLIASFLIGKNVPSHTKGFKYLCNAIELCIENPDYISDITNGLYNKIAEKNNTNPQLIERSIRHVTLLISENGAVDNFTNSEQHNEIQLTNSELICLAADGFVEKYGLLSTQNN